jgi:hypothetical protein
MPGAPKKSGGKKHPGGMPHENALALNCGRNCLDYLIRARGIKSIWLPGLLCGSVAGVCRRHHVEIHRYHIREDYLFGAIPVREGDWLYVADLCGQIPRAAIKGIVAKYKNVIFDEAQAYFAPPVEGADTLYTCRKFFGVPDGAFLHTGSRCTDEIPRDESIARMQALLEGKHGSGYGNAAESDELFNSEPLKWMSTFTMDLLRSIDYEAVKAQRTANFAALSLSLGPVNKLKPRRSEGAFAYPLWLEQGDAVRRMLAAKKIYIPLFWPNVLTDSDVTPLERDLALNVLPVPCDQRYGPREMKVFAQQIALCVRELAHGHPVPHAPAPERG